MRVAGACRVALRHCRGCLSFDSFGWGSVRSRCSQLWELWVIPAPENRPKPSAQAAPALSSPLEENRTMLRSSRARVSLLRSLIFGAATTLSGAALVTSVIGCKDESQPEYWVDKLDNADWR